MVAHLALGQHHDDRPALAVADGVELGVQAAFGAPDTTGNIPFLSRLAAVRWAFKWVASIMMRSGLGPSPARLAKIRSKTPSRLQRMTNSADYRTLVPLVDSMRPHLGRKPREVSGDAGFAKEANLAPLNECGVTANLAQGCGRNGEADASGRLRLAKMPLMSAMAAR